MRSRNPDLCRRLRKVNGFRWSFPCSCDSPVAFCTCNAPKLAKQIHACSIFEDYFLGGGKHLKHGTKTGTLSMSEISKSK